MTGYSRPTAAGAMLALAIAFAVPASAATSEERGLAWIIIAEPCRVIVDDKARNADHLLATCQGALAELEAGYADPARRPQDDLEANFYWLAVVGARTGIGAAYADMDKVRSRRVCEQVAAQDSAAANFKRDAWPAEYRDPIDGMLRSGVSPREKCRNEFGI